MQAASAIVSCKCPSASWHAAAQHATWEQAFAATSITYYRHPQNPLHTGCMVCCMQLLPISATVFPRVVLYSPSSLQPGWPAYIHTRQFSLKHPFHNYVSTFDTHALLACLDVHLPCRPGPADGLNPATLQYSVVSPSATPAIGTPLAITVARKGSTVPLFDTTGQRWVNGCRVSLFAAWSVKLG